jgi:hypothetical protein
MEKKDLFYKDDKYPDVVFVDLDANSAADEQRHRDIAMSRPYQVQRAKEKAEGLDAFARLTGRKPAEDQGTSQN